MLAWLKAQYEHALNVPHRAMHRESASAAVVVRIYGIRAVGKQNTGSPPFASFVLMFCFRRERQQEPFCCSVRC